MSVLNAIGNTSLVELSTINKKKPDVRIFGKLEGSNPGGSVKDRPAYYMVKKAEESGELEKGKTILEPTSGNTGSLDEKMTVEDGEALEMARLLATREVIFVGMSSGAAVAGALKMADRLKKGTIVVILPDRGDRYLSTTLFRSICAKCPP